MTKKNDKNIEFEHFDSLSNEWWDPDGKFKVLHTITPIRVEYIKRNIYPNKHNIKDLKNLRILDLGCGGGLISEPLTKLGAKVTGIDFVKKNIEIAKFHANKSNLKIKYINSDLSSFKANYKFDVILMLEVIEHLDNWKNIIKKIIKNLKPNGKIIFSTINRTFLSKIFAIFIAEEIMNMVPKNTHKFEKLIKPTEIISFLEKNNMRVLDITGLVFNPILREWVLSKKIKKINYFCTAEKIN